LFENSLEKVARLLLFLIHVLKVSYPFLGRRYTSFLEAPRSTLLIPCYSTQVNAIEQLLLETMSCVWVHYYVMQKAWNSKIHSVDSLLQHTGKCHWAVITGNIVMRLGALLRDAESLMWCGKPEHDFWWQPYWETMATIKKWLS